MQQCRQSIFCLEKWPSFQRGDCKLYPSCLRGLRKAKCQRGSGDPRWWHKAKTSTVTKRGDCDEAAAHFCNFQWSQYSWVVKRLKPPCAPVEVFQHVRACGRPSVPQRLGWCTLCEVSIRKINCFGQERLKHFMLTPSVISMRACVISALGGFPIKRSERVKNVCARRADWKHFTSLMPLH